MLFDKLKEIDPAKMALKYQGNHMSYKGLLDEIQNRASFFQNHRADYLLTHVCEVENLINFLALMLTGQKGVFAGKNTSFEQCIALCEKFNLTILDAIPAPENKLEIVFTPKQEDIFLGILTASKEIIWKDYQSWFSAFPAQSEVFKVTSEDRVLVLDALGYSANLNAVLHALWLGATVVFANLKEANQWSRIIKKEAVSSIFLVPSHYRLLPDNNHFSGVNSLVTAGEKLNGQLAKKLLKLFPQATLTEYYGAAELGHISYIQNQDILEKPTSVGKAFPGVNIRILNEKIAVESPYVSPGYRKKPTVNDLGFIDAEGYLTLLGREGRVFNCRKVNLFAEELENVEVFSVQFFKDLKSTENIPILLTKPKTRSQNELNSLLINRLAKQKIASKTSFISDEIPHINTSKVNFKILSKRPVEEESIFILYYLVA